MAHDNNVHIGSAATGSTINIAQHHAPEDKPHIVFTPDPHSMEHLSQSTINKGALAILASVSIPILGVVADVLGILGFLGIQTTTWQVLSVLVPIAVVGTLLSNPMQLFTATITRPNEARFIDGRWIERKEDGDYLTYRKTARCIYPKCSGTVFIQPAPPRERPNHTLVGVCDVGGLQHTFTVDYNGIGVPAKFDWRQVEERKPA
jgi:hypothetical protein